MHFTLEEQGPTVHSIRGWVDPRAGLNTVTKKKSFSRMPGIEPRLMFSVRRLVSPCTVTRLAYFVLEVKYNPYHLDIAVG